MKSKETIAGILAMCADGRSYREISSVYSVGSGTIHRFKDLAAQKGIDFETIDLLSDEEVQSAFYPKSSLRDSKKLMPDYEILYERLHSNDIHTTIKDEWYAYYVEGTPETRYAYTQYKLYYRQWLDENHPGEDAVMTVFREPGRFMFCDWTGDTPMLVRNPDDSEKLMRVHFFVTTIGYSSLTWFKAYEDEKSDKVADAVACALEFYRAVPAALRPDNMATAVTKNTKHELKVSHLMRDLGHHYQMDISPCRPYHPKDKATVERAVRILETEFLAKQKGQVFDSFEQLNKKAAQFRDELNSRRKANESASRWELYRQYDFPAMKPLPSKKFMPFDYIEKRVGKNYLVSFDKHYYSVPFTYVGKTVILKSTSSRIIICDMNNVVIASHDRSWSTDGQNWAFVIDKNHMPPAHQQAYGLINNDFSELLERADEIGPNTRELIDRALVQSELKEETYRMCRGILHSCRKVDRTITEEAALYCLNKHSFVTLTAFKSAVNRFRDQEKSTETELPVHANIRGEEEYK